MSSILEEQARRAAEFGLPPEGPVTEPPNRSLPPSPAGIWSAMSLYDFVPAPKWFEMPGGGGVWIHPLSDDEITWLNLQAAREVRALRLEDEGEAEAQRQARARVWQVILCCRVGEEPGSPPALRPEDAPALRRNPGWWQAIRNICRLSDSLGADEAVLLETMRDFFEALGGLLSTCSSLSNTGAGTSCLGNCASLVSSIRRRGRLTQQDLSALRQLRETLTRTSTASSDPGPPGASEGDARGAA